MNKALFWDFDGTLSYPNKSFHTALYWALCKSGYTIDEHTVTKFLTDAYSWKTPEVSYQSQTNELWWKMFFEKICNFLLKHQVLPIDTTVICEDFRKKLTDISNYKLYDDTIQTLNACIKKGYKNYLITNNYPEILENLKKLNIDQFFSDYIVSSHIGYEKPRKEFFDYAKKISGNPNVVYVIGDNPVADISGGKDAGFITIAVHECKQSNADYYFKNLKQIPSVLI